MEKLTKENFTPEFCRKILKEYKTKTYAARALEGRVISGSGQLASARSIERYILAGLTPAIAGRENEETVSRLEKLLSNHNVPLDQIQQIKDIKIGMWGVHSKDADGNIQTNVLDKTQITLVPNSSNDPAWPIQDRAQPAKIIQYERGPVIARKVEQFVIISDTQIGFLQDPETKRIQPIHDPQAISVAKQIVADIGPTRLAWIGDLMDWPFLSRWQQHDEFDAVNESIQAAYDHLCEMISAAGPKLQQKIIIGGNHDIRPERFLLENNRKALRIRRAADTSQWPVFSQPYLLRYDELGLTYPGHFPGDHHYFLSDLVLTHAPPKAGEFQASVIHGHTHHLTRNTRVQHSSRGRQTYFVYDVGCLCQVGENSNPYSLMRTRVPSDRGRTDWAQGIAVVNVVGETFSVDQIAITNGKAIYGGQYYEAKDPA